MERVTIFSSEQFHLQPDAREVFGWLGCTDQTPCSAIFRAGWEEAVRLLGKSLQPRAVLYREGLEATVFLTLGPEAESCVTGLFQRQEFILGSLLNTLCDEMLFQMDSQVSAMMQRLLAAEEVYVDARFEPGNGFPPHKQQQCFAPMREALPYAFISERGNLFPAKSMMYHVTLSRQLCVFTALHDCSRCSQVGCLYRKEEQR